MRLSTILREGIAMATAEFREEFIEGPRGKTWYKIVGNGPGFILITVHGGPGATHGYLEALEGLSNERQVLFYDQLGAGKSDVPADVSDWNNDKIVEELTRLLDALSFDRVHLLGHSWGATIAVEYALRRQDRLASLILDNPVISVPLYGQGLAELRSQLPTEDRETLERHEAAGTITSSEYQAASAEFLKRHNCRLENCLDLLNQLVPQMNLAIYDRMLGPNFYFMTGTHRDYDLAPRLSEVKVPTLMMCGRHSTTRPKETARFASLLDGAEMVVFEESGHFPILEEPQHYLGVMRDFLRWGDTAAT
jgi:proline iminopeptidase